MWPNYTLKILHREGKHWQNEKTTYWLADDMTDKR